MKQNKTPLSITEILVIVFCVAAGAVTIFRCFYSVDLTDESYYYADAINAICGSLPFTHNISAQAGMCYLMLPPLAIFRLFSPEWAGVVLYMRLCFAVLRLAAVYIIYRLLRRHFDRLPVLLGVAVLTGWFYFCNAFSYLTIPPWIIMTASAMIYDCIGEDVTKRTVLMLAVAGVFSALAVFANPLAAGCVAVLLVLIPVFSKKGTKWKKLLAYSAGGVLMSGIILLATAIVGGFERTIKGIYFLFTMGQGSMEDKELLMIELFFDNFKWSFLVMAAAAGITVIICRLKKMTDTAFTAAASAFSAGIIAAICFTIKKKDLFEVESYAGIAALCLVIFLLIMERKNAFLWIFSQPLAAFVLIYLTISPDSSPLSHTAFFAPTVVPIVIILFEKVRNKAVPGVAVMLLAVWIAACDLLFVYRDAPLGQLDTRVEEGVYEGIMTTKTRAKCLVEMERWIEDNTKDGERISFRDCAPFACLMYHKPVCDVRTWDDTEYGSDNIQKNFEGTFVYYALTGMIPDKYIYVDFGREDKLSIETEKWEFNEWVNSYYHFEKEEQVNEMFRTKVYAYNGGFDGNFKYWRNLGR